MNRSIFSYFVSLSLVLAFVPTLCAQNAQIGAGLFIATDETLDVGFDIRGTYAFDSNFRAAFILNVFVPQRDKVTFGGLASSTTISTTYTGLSINLEGNYCFPLNTDKAVPYFLAGINFVTVGAKVEGTNSVLTGSTEAAGSESGVSANIGVGTDLKINQLCPFVEFKYSIGEADYASILAGLKFQF